MSFEVNLSAFHWWPLESCWGLKS